MAKKLCLIIGSYMHLPSGSSEAEFEALYEREIKPLVQALNKFPSVNMVFCYSGVILHWIERRHPELFMLLEDLLSRKQAEFLGGGFYNPMLPLLPQSDKIGQIEMLTTYIRKQFGKRPQGCWFPSLAWEQSLVVTLNSCGMSYTFMEESQFLNSRTLPNEAGLFYPCITEDQGKLITVFPVARTLGRQLRKDVFEKNAFAEKSAFALDFANEEFFKKLPDGDFPVVVFPFENPSGNLSEDSLTAPFPYEDFFKSLHESFMLSLSSHDYRIEFTTPLKVYKGLRNLKRTYFSGIWALPGSGEHTHPKQFLSDHAEAGGIYAKMVYVHTLITNQLRGDKTRKRTALEELWKAQDSHVFSLGSSSSPGLLHSQVRKAAYKSLIEAEKITREKGKFVPALSSFDFDLDGEGEYIFQDEKLNCCIKPHGAGIFELDYLPAAWNYLDTFSPERGQRRMAFTDWFAPSSSLVEQSNADGIPSGHSLGGELYEVLDADRARKRLTLKLTLKPDLPYAGIEIEKTWHLKKNSLVVEYILKNSGENPLNFVFCPQIDISFSGEGENCLRILPNRDGAKECLIFSDSSVVRAIKELEFQDIKNEAILTLEASRLFEAKIFHIRSNTGSLSAKENYQSTCIMPFFPVSLGKEKSWKAAFSLKISS